MTEKSYYAAITSYYVRTARETVFWEAKFVRTDRLSFAALAAHQEVNLLKEVLGYKIPDNGIGQKPADGFVLYRPKSVVIAIYYKPGATEIYEIGIRAFVEEKYSSKEKSLTKEKAATIGRRIFI